MLSRRLFTAAGLAGLATPAFAQRAVDQQELVDRARAVVERFRVDPDMNVLNRMLVNCKAAVVVPSLVRAGFVLGGEGGSGVACARGPDGTWSPPAFVYLASASVGLQIGVQDAEVILVVMTDNGLNQVTTNEIRLGADASVAAGPVGIGVEAATTLSFGADIYAYSRARGLFGGLSLEGSVMRGRYEYNRAYYGQPYTTREIMIARRGNNPNADGLRTSLAQR